MYAVCGNIIYMFADKMVYAVASFVSISPAVTSRSSLVLINYISTSKKVMTIQNIVFYTTTHSSTMFTAINPFHPPTIIILSGDGLTTKHLNLPLDIEPISTHCPSTSW